MADALNEILDDLDGEMLGDYQEYARECVEPWASFKGNHGQLIIVQNHIIPAAEQHAHFTRTDWPLTATADDYYNDILNCYDQDVIQRAFGDTLEEIYSNLSDIWLDAEGMQREHEFITDGGENAGPHSTHDIWRGGPVGPII